MQSRRLVHIGEEVRTTTNDPNSQANPVLRASLARMWNYPGTVIWFDDAEAPCYLIEYANGSKAYHGSTEFNTVL
jgi:hypothetical protein